MLEIFGVMLEALLAIISLSFVFVFVMLLIGAR
jgi:hypothetical protein